MKLLTILAMAVLSVSAAFGQLTNVTASHLDSDLGLGPLTAQFCLTPTLANHATGFSANGSAQVMPIQKCFAATGGVLNISVPDTAFANPPIGYKAVVKQANGVAIYTYPQLLFPTGTTWSLDSYAPTQTALVTTPSLSLSVNPPTGDCGSAISFDQAGTIATGLSLYGCSAHQWALLQGSSGGGSGVQADWNATTGLAVILNKPTLATVATSGSYADLSNKPSIPAAPVNPDWNASSGLAQILNKPALGTASSHAATDFDAAGAAAADAASAQSAAEAFTTGLAPNYDAAGAAASALVSAKSYTDGKAANYDAAGTASAAIAALPASARSGSYTDLTNKPTLGTAAAQNTTAFDAAGAASTAQAASLQKSANLSDLASASTARTNLGLGSAATQASTAFDAAGAATTAQAASAQKASNLSDLANLPAALANILGNPTSGTYSIVCASTTSCAPVTATTGGSSGFPITLGGTSIAAGSTNTTLTGLTLDGVSPTTFSFLDATSSIQTQLNSKAATSSLGTAAAHAATDFAAPVTASAAGQTLVSTGPGSTYAASSYTGIRSAPSINVVFDGDSLTIGTGTVSPTTRWATLLLTYPEWAGRVGTSTNVAISGQTCEQRLSAYSTAVHPLSPAVTGVPSIYFIWVGTNDVGVDTASALYTCVSSLWTDAKNDGFTVVASTLHSTGNHEPAPVANITMRESFNELVRQAGPSATTYDYLMEPDEVYQDPHDLSWMQPDFIHPGPAGNARFASYVNGLIWNHGVTFAPMASQIRTGLGTGPANWRDTMWSLFALTTGASNEAIGINNLTLLTTGNQNEAIGYGVLNSEVTGTDNTAMGFRAGGNATGSQNTFVGSTTGASCTTCSASEAIGYSANVGAAVAGAAQIGSGTNNTSNTLQFQGWNFLDSSGDGTFATVDGVSFSTMAFVDLTSSAQTQLNGKVANTTTVNGHPLSSNVVVSASDLTTGTLPHAQLPALVSGDIPANAANTSGTAANLSGTPALPNGTTATTQTSTDTTTKIATDAFASTAAASAQSAATAAAANASNLSSGTVAMARLSLPLSCQPGIGDGLNAITAGTYLTSTCRNETGQTWTLTSIKCVADSGSSTCAVTNGAGTALLTGAITGTSTYATGTQSSTTTIAAGDYLKITYVADGTSKQIGIDVTGTY